MRQWLSFVLVIALTGCGASTEDATTQDAGEDTSNVEDVATADVMVVDSTVPDSRTFVPLPDTSPEPDTHVEYDFGPPDGPPPPPPDTTIGGCNELVQKGSMITATAWTAPLPTFTGGPIADGTYVLTKLAITDGMPLTTRAETDVFSGASFEAVAEFGSYVGRTRGTIAMSGTTLTASATCPTSATDAAQYSATGGTLLVYDAMEHELAWYEKL